MTLSPAKRSTTARHPSTPATAQQAATGAHRAATPATPGVPFRHVSDLTIRLLRAALDARLALSIGDMDAARDAAEHAALHARRLTTALTATSPPNVASHTNGGDLARPGHEGGTDGG